jgi:hypothetical protein
MIDLITTDKKDKGNFDIPSLVLQGIGSAWNI